MRHLIVVATAMAAALACPAHAALVISSGPTSNVSCSGNVCSATARDAVLNAPALQTMLASADVKVVAAKGRSIVVAAPLSWISASTLTLSASTTLQFTQPVTVEGTGGVVLSAPDLMSIAYAAGASIAFWDNTSALTINGNAYKLVDDIASLNAPPGKYVALAKSYDAGPDGTYGQAPVADFNAVLDGLGNAVSNLTISSTTPESDVGLFGLLGSDGVVAHLKLTNAQVGGGNNSTVGGLVGLDDGEVIGSAVDGTVQVGASVGGEVTDAGGLVGTIAQFVTVYTSSSSAGVSGGTGSWVGGLVGYGDDGTVVSSSASGAVTGGGGSGSAAGGLMGYGNGSEIGGSSASGAVSGAQYAGGLIGYAAGGNYGESYATGPVTGGDGATIGGLIGYAAGGVARTFATGTVTMSGTGAAGGLIGEASATVQNSYATSSVSGAGLSDVGGLIGLNHHTLSYVYASGAVEGAANARTGGLIGVDEAAAGSIVDAYWDMTTSGIKRPARGAGNVANDPGITGLTSHALMSGLPTGFSNSVWSEQRHVNGGLPFLTATPPN